MTVVMKECRIEITVPGVSVLRIMMRRRLRGMKKALKTK